MLALTGAIGFRLLKRLGLARIRSGYPLHRIRSRLVANLRTTGAGGRATTQRNGIHLNCIFLSLSHLNGEDATVIAHTVDDGLATLRRTRPLKLKIDVRIVDDTQQEQPVSRVIAEKGAQESAIAWVRYIRRYPERKAHRALRRRDRLVGLNRARLRQCQNGRSGARSRARERPRALP